MNEHKFGDLLLVQHNLKNYYHTLHYSMYYAHNSLLFRNIKNLLNNSLNILTFNQNYKEIRNYIFGANITEENNELKEIKSLLSTKTYLQINDLKFRILDWMLSAINSNDVLPIAANKNST